MPIVQTCSLGVLCDIRRAAQTQLRRGSERVRRCHLEVEDRTALDFAAGQIRAGCSRGGLRRLKDLAEDIMGAADCANEAVCIKTTHSWAENQPAGPCEVRQRARAMRCCADLGRCTRAWGGSLDLGLLPRGGGSALLQAAARGGPLAPASHPKHGGWCCDASAIGAAEQRPAMCDHGGRRGRWRTLRPQLRPAPLPL